MPGPWTYPPELADALGALGVAPKPATPPALAREVVNDLYRYELRQLRERLRRGAVPRREYTDLVVALRKKYWMLTLPPAAWDRLCEPPT